MRAEADIVICDETPAQRAANRAAAAQLRQEMFAADAILVAAQRQADRVGGLDQADRETLTVAVLRAMLRASDKVIATWQRERGEEGRPS